MFWTYAHPDRHDWTARTTPVAARSPLSSRVVRWRRPRPSDPQHGDGRVAAGHDGAPVRSAWASTTATSRARRGHGAGAQPHRNRQKGARARVSEPRRLRRRGALSRRYRGASAQPEGDYGDALCGSAGRQKLTAGLNRGPGPLGGAGAGAGASALRRIRFVRPIQSARATPSPLCAEGPEARGTGGGGASRTAAASAAATSSFYRNGPRARSRPASSSRHAPPSPSTRAPPPSGPRRRARRV